MAVTAQRGPQALARRGRLIGEQPGQVAWHLTPRGLGDDLGRGVADALQRLQSARLDPPSELARGQGGEHRGGPAEGLDAVRRRPAPLQFERDPPQRLLWVHVACPTHAQAGLSGCRWPGSTGRHMLRHVIAGGF